MQKRSVTVKPKGDQASLIHCYGNPEGPKSVKTGGGQFNADPDWVQRNLILVPREKLPNWPRYPGANGLVQVSGVRVHRLVAPVLIETWAEVNRRKLASKLRTYDGAFMARHMLWRYDRPLSVHAFGAAIDFDARWNGYGLPHAQMAINRDVVAIFKDFGWTWGGDWSPSDGMHFQWTQPV